MKEIRPLTSIRFILAFWIVLFHYQDKLWASAFGSVDSISLGYIAVSVFFILSGFILTINYFATRDTINQGQFLVSRVARIYPVYLFSLIVSAPYYLYYVLQNNLSLSQIILALGSLGIAILMIQAWFARFALVVNGPAWSLSVEAFFYLLFPYLGSKLKQQSNRQILLVMAAMLLVSFLTSMAVTVFLGAQQYSAIGDFTNKHGLIASVLKYNPLVRLPEFIIGIGLGFLYLNKKTEVVSARFYLVGFCISCGVIYLLREAIPFLVAHNTIFIVPASLLILGLTNAQNNSFVQKILSNNVLVFLGKSSYALYLIHQPVLWYTVLIWQALDLSVLTSAILSISISIASSMLIYQLIEEPCRQKLKEVSFDPFYFTKGGFRPQDIFIANKR